MTALTRRRRTKVARNLSALTGKQRRILDAAKASSKDFDNKMFGRMYVHAIEEKLYGNDIFFRFLRELDQPPVDIETFLDSDQFFGSTDLVLWPEVRKAIVEINCNWWKGEKGGAYSESLLMGATSTGKSEIAKVTMAYHLHILGCMKNPQVWYSLPKATAIVFVFQAAKPHVAKRVLYSPLRTYIETMPWFQEHMRPVKLIESEMMFTEKNVRVVPCGSDADAILGEAIIGGAMDEVNFMQVVEHSRRAEVGEGGRGGKYDQASVMHGALTRRKRGRFLSVGPAIGIITCSSSTRYRNDFTDRRKAQVEASGLQTVYIYNKAQYEVWPPARYSGEKFEIVIENEAATDVRILEEGKRPPRGATILEIPIEHLEDFNTDAVGALRDICGISVNSMNPFFRRRSKISEAVSLAEQFHVESFLLKDNVVLGEDGMPVVTRGHYCQDPSRPRYVHIDLSNTMDRCGIAMVRFDGLEQVSRSTNGEVEVLPIATVEMAVSIQPDHNEELDLGEVRAWVRMLHKLYGYPIKAVTYDGWQSLESRQQWKKQGMRTAALSVDRTAVPYKQFRDSVYDGRIRILNQPVLIEEMLDLEYDEKKDKIDHPPNGSKDLVDAVCGAYHTLLTRSQTWNAVDDREMYEDRAEFDERR